MKKLFVLLIAFFSIFPLFAQRNFRPIVLRPVSGYFDPTFPTIRPTSNPNVDAIPVSALLSESSIQIVSFSDCFVHIEISYGEALDVYYSQDAFLDAPLEVSIDNWPSGWYIITIQVDDVVYEGSIWM